MATTEEVNTTAAANLPAYVNKDRIDAINRMYDAYGQSEQNRIQSSLEQNLSDLEANRSKIAQEYQTQRNMSAVNYERQRRNFNQQAMMNGLNTGAGSQARLAQNNAFQTGLANLGSSEATAYSDLDKSIVDAKRKAQEAIDEAISKNDYNRAAAVLDEYNTSYSQYMTRAQQLAQYGDFSGYAVLYGSDAARQMEQTWLLQNPLLAYNLGRISAGKYKQITGSNPPGYSTGRSGGGGGYRSGSAAEAATADAGTDGISLTEANGSTKGSVQNTAAYNQAARQAAINRSLANNQTSSSRPSGKTNPSTAIAQSNAANMNNLINSIANSAYSNAYLDMVRSNLPR